MRTWTLGDVFLAALMVLVIAVGAAAIVLVWMGVVVLWRTMP